MGCHFFSPPGDLPDSGIKPASPMSPVLQTDSLLLSYQGSPFSALQTPILLFRTRLPCSGAHIQTPEGEQCSTELSPQHLAQARAPKVLCFCVLNKRVSACLRGSHRFFVTLACSPFLWGCSLQGLAGEAHLPFPTGTGPLSLHLLSPHYHLGLGYPGGPEPLGVQGCPLCLPTRSVVPGRSDRGIFQRLGGSVFPVRLKKAISPQPHYTRPREQRESWARAPSGGRLFRAPAAFISTAGR